MLVYVYRIKRRAPSIPFNITSIYYLKFQLLLEQFCTESLREYT